MDHVVNSSSWQPLTVLQEQFRVNLAALGSRDCDLAVRLGQVKPTLDYFIAGSEQRIDLTRYNGTELEQAPNPVPAIVARQIAWKLFPTGKCSEPVLVAGLDQGWLWNTLYRMEVHTPRTPGHRPPLYFLASDIERLWVVMHLQEWSELLVDPRVRLFVGPDAVQQVQQSLIHNPIVPWPRLSVTIDPTIWPVGVGIDRLLETAHQAATTRIQQLTGQLNALDASIDPLSLPQQLVSDKLRVLGITSLFTTFLQYSMRDWLSAFEELGHETRLLIEQEPHQIANPILFAEVSAEFRPHLILMIDHYRAEFSGLPKNIPCVMWVQDRLPNIFRAQAGAGQSPMDYVLGYGRQECIVSHEYPRQRFMPAMVGFNPARFVAGESSDEDRARFACDVSFVSHASTPPQTLVQTEIERAAHPQAKRFLADAFERLRAIYDAGSFVTETGHIRRIIQESMRECGVETADMTGVLDFFKQKVNNALFRQQAIAWVAQLDIDLHLYGRGWEDHPRFRRYARGIADNQKQLGAIYQASAINLQVTPFGAVHQRLFDGLAAGGFFLLRHCTGDTCDLIYRGMWRWCERAQIRSGEQFFTQAPPEVREMISRIIDLTGVDPSTIPDTFFLGLEEAAQTGFTRSGATLWDQYDRVAFSTREQVHNLVRHYLASPDQRRQIAASMRQRVIESMSYKAITQRLLVFIVRDLRERLNEQRPRGVAA